MTIEKLKNVVDEKEDEYIMEDEFDDGALPDREEFEEAS